MRHMALDVGDERIGVALSDESGLLATPLEIIRRVPGPASFLRLAEIVRERGVERIVVGLPLLPDGSEGEQVASTQAYVRGLVRYVDLPIDYWDERYTSNEARDIVEGRGGERETGTPPRRRRPRRSRRLDDVAAAVILQDYLDHHRGGSHP